MPKHATHQTLRHHHNLLLLCVLALFLVLFFLAFKYVWIKQTWYGNTVSLQSGLKNYQALNSTEDAKVLATTITTIPAGLPLIKQSAPLQKYITAISELTGRDIVILNKNKVIIADTVPLNIDGGYVSDNGEIDKTMFDGEPRSFIEKSTDYPDGVEQTVIQLKDQSGTIIGAIIISNSNIFK